MKVYNPWKLPSPLALAVQQLEGAQRDRLAASAHAEFYSSQRDMLIKREERLKKDIDKLKGEME